jgi:hypothetical protein
VPDPNLLLESLDGGHLAVAFAVALVVAAVAPRYAHLALAAGIGVGGLDVSPDAILPAIAAALAGASLRQPGPRIRRSNLGPVVLAVGGAGALYACVPDTERARALLGATAACALVALAGRRRWRRCMVATAAAVAAIALIDGEPRSSALLAGLGIALILAFGRFGAGPRSVERAAIGLVAMAALSRVIGLTTATDWPALAATAVTAVTVAATRSLGDDPDEDQAPLLAS